MGASASNVWVVISNITIVIPLAQGAMEALGETLPKADDVRRLGGACERVL